MNRLPFLIPLIIILMIDVYIFRKFQDIKQNDYQCKCGQTWHVNNISNTIVTIISINLLVLILQLYLTGIDNKTQKMAMVSASVSIVSFSVQIYYLYLMISYLNNLKENKCECVDTTLTTTMFYYSYTRITLMIFGTLLLMIIMLIVIPAMFSNQAIQPIPTKTSSIKKISKRS